MDAIAEAEEAAEDGVAVAFAVEGLVAELRALRPALIAADARADAAEARAGAAAGRSEAAAADIEGVQRVVHEVLRAAASKVDDDANGDVSSRLAEGLSAAEAVRLALEVAANDKGAVAAARREAAAASSEQGSLKADLKEAQDIAAARAEEVEAAQAESVRAIRMADEWKEASFEAQAKVREHVMAAEAAARDASEARRELMAALEERDAAVTRAAAAEAALDAAKKADEAAVTIASEHDHVDARLATDAADAAPLRRALMEARAALSAASAARFEAEAAAAAAEERAAAAERRAERCDDAEKEAAALRATLRNVNEERETLAHVADLARSANASLTVERDAATAAAAALDLELIDARDAAERLRAEKHVMQAMVANADAAVRGGATFSVATLLDESSTGPGDDGGDGGTQGTWSGAFVGDLDAMTAEMQRKRRVLETARKEKLEGDEGDEGNGEDVST